MFMTYFHIRNFKPVSLSCDIDVMAGVTAPYSETCYTVLLLYGGL